MLNILLEASKTQPKMPLHQRTALRKLRIVLITLFSIIIIAFMMGSFAASGSRSGQTFEPIKCLVKQSSNIHQFDEVWHIIRGSDGKPIDCVNVGQWKSLNNNTNVTMQELVYAFQIPVNNSIVQLSKWITSLSAYLSLSVDFKVNNLRARRPELTYEVRLGHRNSNKKNEWALIAESTESRKLRCNINPDGTVKGSQYGCNLIPFFTIWKVYNEPYIINLRFPTDFRGKTAFNYDVRDIHNVKLIFSYENIDFTKVMLNLKILFYPTAVGVYVWFTRHLYYSPLISEEKGLIILGASVILANMPIEFISLFKEIPFIGIFNYIRQNFFFAAMIGFWSVFCEHFFRSGHECALMRSHWLYMSPLLLFFPIFIVDLFEKFLQLNNPFFSTWNGDFKFRHYPEFNIVAALVVTFYLLFFGCRGFQMFTNVLVERKIVLVSRGGMLFKGGVPAFRFLLHGITTSILLILCVFLLNQVDDLQFKYSGSMFLTFKYIEPGISAAIYALWNAEAIAFLVFYAPARSYRDEDEENN